MRGAYIQRALWLQNKQESSIFIAVFSHVSIRTGYISLASTKKIEQKVFYWCLLLNTFV